MISFFINIYRLVVAVGYGLKEDEDFRGLMILMLSLLAGAVVFYSNVEGWSMVDTIYFSVMTMSTIGYGDLVPTSSLSKSFTIVFSILSIGVFAAVVSKVVQIILVRKKERPNRHPG